MYFQHVFVSYKDCSKYYCDSQLIPGMLNKAILFCLFFTNKIWGSFILELICPAFFFLQIFTCPHKVNIIQNLSNWFQCSDTHLYSNTLFFTKYHSSKISCMSIHQCLSAEWWASCVWTLSFTFLSHFLSMSHKRQDKQLCYSILIGIFLILFFSISY